MNMISKKEAQDIVNNLYAPDIIENTYNELTPMTGCFCTSYLNCETGEVFQFSGTKGTTITLRASDESLLVELYSLTYQEVCNIPDVDILGDDSMPESEDITDLEDYDDRVVEALSYYADQKLNLELIHEQIDEIYHTTGHF